MSSCFGRRRPSTEHEPLLPVYHDDTVLQRRLHQKLHTYQMVRAMGHGFMPSTEQTIVNIRTLLASDVLNPDEYDVSDSGRLLAARVKQFLQRLIDFLAQKNEKDELQDFAWLLTKSRVSFDVGHAAAQVQNARNKANAAMVYQSLRTVAGYLFSNTDFRVLVADLQTIGRQVLKDFAGSLGQAADNTAKSVDQIGPDVRERGSVKMATSTVTTKDTNDSQDESLIALETTDNAAAPTKQDLAQNLTDVTETVGRQMKTVAHDTAESAEQQFSGEQRAVLISRLKTGITKLRHQKDYTESVSFLSLLVQRLAFTYSRAIEKTVEGAERDITANQETHAAAMNFWSFLRSFGKPEEWERLEERFHRVLEHQKADPALEMIMTDLADVIQEFLTDPDAWDNIEERIQRVSKGKQSFQDSDSLRQDVIHLVRQCQVTYATVVHDSEVEGLWNSALRVVHSIFPENSSTPINPALYHDAVNAFIPLLIQGIQYIPIPRLEISAPEVDLLLENLILEPGKTINHSSFLPFRLKIETENDLEIRKARTRVTSSITSLTTIKIDGLSVRADEVGFWLRAHSGLFRLGDEGIASFHLDERGMDIHLDVEVGADRLEKVLSLRDVRVKIHKLTYKLRKSKFSWLAWLIKPFLQPILRKVLEKQLANAIGDFIHAANREIVFARERLRATRIADPQDIATFFKAVTARLQPEPDPDVDVRLGVAQPGKGVFKGIYAPGSIVKLWNEEAIKAPTTIESFDRGGWRNDIFNIIQ